MVQVINAQVSFGSQFQYESHTSLTHTAPERIHMVFFKIHMFFFKKKKTYTKNTKTSMI
jgi:hypothetical protein